MYRYTANLLKKSGGSKIMPIDFKAFQHDIFAYI